MNLTPSPNCLAHVMIVGHVYAQTLATGSGLYILVGDVSVGSAYNVLTTGASLKTMKPTSTSSLKTMKPTSTSYASNASKRQPNLGHKRMTSQSVSRAWGEGRSLKSILSCRSLC